MDNLAAILLAVAAFAVFAVLVWAISRGARRLLGNDATLIDAVRGCASCAARPVCETGAIAGWPRHPAGCPNVERLRSMS
jgi:hypothetical protein